MARLELTVERVIAAPPAAIFDAFVDLYGESRPDWIVDSELDLRVGGEWNVTFAPEPAARFEERRTITRLERPALLEYAALIVPADDRPELETDVELRFDAEGEGTRVRLRQRGFPDADSRDDFAGGWTAVLALLEERAT